MLRCQPERQRARLAPGMGAAERPAKHREARELKPPVADAWGLARAEVPSFRQVATAWLGADRPAEAHRW
jgi:hypothetical protein